MPDPKSRKPGRPKKSRADPDLRQTLLKQAEQMFAEQGYDAVSLRKLADAAGLTPAMIHYYFKNKDGLYSAMLGELTGRLLMQIEKAAAEDPGPDPFRTLMDIASRTITAEPWAVTLIVREVLLRPGPLREQFIETYAAKMTALLTAFITDGKEKGEIRADVDEGYATISLLGMTLFPFIARGVVEGIFDLDYSEEMRRDYVDHAAKLFHQGIKSTKAKAVV